MSENCRTNVGKKVRMRDYSKPIAPIFRGEKGIQAYIKVVTSPRVKYDAKAAAERAAEDLRKQCFKI